MLNSPLAKELLAKHGQTLIPLDEIATEYLGLSIKTARRYWRMGRLPIQATKLSDGRKAPLFVHIDDLARHIDRRRHSENQYHKR